MAKARQKTKSFDAYPSRVFDQPRLVDRLDPVVHAGKQLKSLSSSQLASYEKNGYLIIPKFISDAETRRLNDKITELAANPVLHERPEVIRESNGAVRSIFNPHDFDSTFGTLATSQRMLNRAQDILGSPVYLHQYRINIKPPFEGGEFYWHSDFETWHVEDGMPRIRAVSGMIFLEENNEFNGPLLVIPGSHHTFISCVGATPESHYKLSLVKQEYGIPDEATLNKLVKENGLKSIKGPAGSLLLFDCNLMHGSAGNISPYGRSNLFIVYNSCQNALVEPFCGLEPRPSYIANRDSSPC